VNGLRTNVTPGHAFISYVHEDGALVDRLQSILEAAGIKVWRDVTALWPGEVWQDEVRKAIIDNSLAFIACFSETSQRRFRTFQAEELQLAAAIMRERASVRQYEILGQEWLIPVRFSKCEMPDYDLGAGRNLGDLQYVDFPSQGSSWERAGARLVAAVLRILQTDVDLSANPWRFKDAESVTVVCAELPDRMRGPMADPHHPDYDKIYQYSDLGSLFELLEYLRAVNPSTQVDLLSPLDLLPPPDPRSQHQPSPHDCAAQLISLGPVGLNEVTQHILDRGRFPIKYLPDWELRSNALFGVEPDGREVIFNPIFEQINDRETLKRDVALFGQAPNPFKAGGAAWICSGIHARGTYGAVRALTDPEFRDRNAHYLANRFESSDSFCILSPVQVQSGITYTPDWTLPDDRFFEWSPSEDW
jgi:TIR domain